MSFQINRRKFLQALIAVGASYTIPTKATNEQIEKIWIQAQEQPWFFEVNDLGTLVDAAGDYMSQMRPMIDVIWQSAGFEKSPNFDAQGNWTPPRTN